MARKQRPPREAAVQIVRTLQDAGHVAYLAGGCVRDTLRGETPKDYDVATDALPGAVMRLIPRSRFVGEAFGVVLARVFDHDVEVATFRKEGRYLDGRRPEEVSFTDARQDALRRDFTINGLFEDPFADAEGGDDTAPMHGRIIDYVDGRADLQRGVIRAIGDADDRFAEDYLRMLRAVRFAARLGFRIEEQTQRAIRMHARYLGQISRERIGMEVLAMLASPSRAVAAALLDELNLDGPALNEEHLERDYTTLANLPADATIPASLAAWLIDRQFDAASSTASHGGRQDAYAAFAAAMHTVIATRVQRAARRWRSALSLSNEHYRGLLAVFAQLSKALDWPVASVAARKRLLACSEWHMTASVVASLGARCEAASWAERVRVESMALQAEGVAPDPWVSGQDLIDIGLKPGPMFRRWLDRVYDAQLEGRVTSREQALELVRELSDAAARRDDASSGR